MKTFRLMAATVLLASALLTQAEERAARTPLLLPILENASLMTFLERLSAIEAGSQAHETEDGVALPMAAMDVFVARVDADGNVSYSCTDSAETIRQLLDLPATRRDARKAQAQ